MQKIGHFITSSLCLAMVCGCTSMSPGHKKDMEKTAAITAETHAAADMEQFFSVDMAADEVNTAALTEEAAIKNTMVHFAFDSTELTDQDLAAIKSHAEYLISHPNKKLHIAGHTDLRGSHKYNIALGEARAQAVAKILMAQGVPSTQLVTATFGKEMPCDVGTTEAAYARNRRTEMKYEG